MHGTAMAALALSYLHASLRIPDLDLSHSTYGSIKKNSVYGVACLRALFAAGGGGRRKWRGD